MSLLLQPMYSRTISHSTYLFLFLTTVFSPWVFYTLVQKNYNNNIKRIYIVPNDRNFRGGDSTDQFM